LQGGLSFEEDTVSRLRPDFYIQISLNFSFSLANNVTSKWPQSSVLHLRVMHHVGGTFAIWTAERHCCNIDEIINLKLKHFTLSFAACSYPNPSFHALAFGIVLVHHA